MEEQVQRLRRRVDEQVLERAEADPQWRRLLLDDPDAAMNSIPECRQLQEILPLPGAPTTPLSIAAQEEYRQLTRSLKEKMLDRAASDPTWKRHLLDNPDAALREANFPELERLEEINQREEVQGQLSDPTSLEGYPTWHCYTRHCCSCGTYCYW